MDFQHQDSECFVTCLSSLFEKEREICTHCFSIFIYADETWVTRLERWTLIYEDMQNMAQNKSQDDSKCNKGNFHDLVTRVAAQLHLFSQQTFQRRSDSCIVWIVNFFMLVDATFVSRKGGGKRKSKRGCNRSHLSINIFGNKMSHNLLVI